MAYRNPNIYKILVMMMYGNYEWMRRVGKGFVELRTSPMSKFLNIKPASLRDIFRWCEQYKYINKLEIGYGYARFRVPIPELLLKEYGVKIPKDGI